MQTITSAWNFEDRETIQERIDFVPRVVPPFDKTGSISRTMGKMFEKRSRILQPEWFDPRTTTNHDANNYTSTWSKELINGAPWVSDRYFAIRTDYLPDRYCEAMNRNKHDVAKFNSRVMQQDKQYIFSKLIAKTSDRAVFSVNGSMQPGRLYDQKYIGLFLLIDPNIRVYIHQDIEFPAIICDSSEVPFAILMAIKPNY